MASRGRLAAMLLAVLCFAGTTPAQAAPLLQPTCTFVLGFQTLYDAIPTVVGDCVDNQAFAANGDALQHTANGLLVWRKADNWTAFTNGNATWINGPSGLVARTNAQRFSWEANPDGLPLATPLGVTVAVQTCATAFGVTGESVRPFPAALPSSGAAEALAGLSYYTDGFEAVLAPSGWRCNAQVTADGSQLLAIAPSPPPAWPPAALSPQAVPEAVTASIPSQGTGDVAALVCVLFPNAPPVAEGLPPCRTGVPPGELVSPISATAVGFEDPASVAGDGIPSGGANPANGVMLFGMSSFGGQPFSTGAEVSCTLPDALHVVCTTVLNDFIARFPV